MTTYVSNPTETATGLALETNEITLANGEMYEIKANQENLTYKSSNTDVVIVSKSGAIAAVGVGTAIVTVYNSEYDFVQLKVTVVPEAMTKEPLTGDFNEDGIVDIDDAASVLSLYAMQAAGIPIEGDLQQKILAADVDHDGACTINDAACILQYYATLAAGFQITWEEIISA